MNLHISSTQRLIHCPQCHGELRRTWRRPVDRFASTFLPLHRYRCDTFTCQWEGNFRTQSQNAKATEVPSKCLPEPKPVAHALPGLITSASAFAAVLLAILFASQWPSVEAWASLSHAAADQLTSASSVPTAMGKEIPIGPRTGAKTTAASGPGPKPNKP